MVCVQLNQDRLFWTREISILALKVIKELIFKSHLQMQTQKISIPHSQLLLTDLHLLEKLSVQDKKEEVF